MKLLVDINIIKGAMMNCSQISIITRTKNREIMLARLRDNLLQQTNFNFEWVIVNDCGDISVVNRVINGYQKQLNIQVINNQVPKGRSYPANLGVESCTGDYAVILDDDDYIAPEFCEVFLDFLNANPSLNGVTCWSQVILEELIDGEISNSGRGRSYQPSYYDLSIMNMHIHNIPTCGFVFSKSIFKKIGGYPIGVEYTEDWNFMTRFILDSDIGVIPKTLSFISHRIAPVGEYKNTTSDQNGLDQHLKDEILWFNQRFRDKVRQGDISAVVPLFSHLARQNIAIDSNIRSSVLLLCDKLDLINTSLNELNRQSNKIFKLFKIAYRISCLKYLYTIYKKMRNTKIL